MGRKLVLALLLHVLVQLQHLFLHCYVHLLMMTLLINRAIRPFSQSHHAIAALSHLCFVSSVAADAFSPPAIKAIALRALSVEPIMP